ncbi:MAG: hypothetical protein EPN62_14510 [Candidimonas sp.]|nr:MAG: hypothetical protein EPN77_03800 [Candidimonas sp.]TAM21289.1 MAG: hypothetical protein EPN62_14510 [Candidimonas sp.]
MVDAMMGWYLYKPIAGYYQLELEKTSPGVFMLRKAVVMFLLKKRNAYDPVGSGTFVFHDGKLLIVSAAHVFEDLSKKGDIYLHVGAVNCIFHLGLFKVFLSKSLTMSRAEDPLDLGLMVVPAEIIDACNGKIVMVQEDMIETERNKDQILFYQAIGYPASKNARRAEKSARTGTLFSPEILVYSGSKKISGDVANKKFVDKHHVIFDWNGQENFDDDGTRVDAPKPNGISGGIIQGCFDYVPHSNGFYPTCAAGIITERDSAGNAIVGTRFSTVFEWFKLQPTMFT